MPARAGVIGAAAIAALAATAAGPALADRSAKIDQVVKNDTLAERSTAAQDQIGTTIPERRGSIEQIDPAARPRYENDERALAVSAQRPPRQEERDCEVGADQAAIIESLKAQGKIVGDDCDLIDWVAVTGDRSGRDDRRAVAEALAATRPELLSIEAEREREQAEKLEQERIEAARAAAGVLVNGEGPAH